MTDGKEGYARRGRKRQRATEEAVDISLSELGDSSRLACDGKQLGGALSGTRGSGKAALSAVYTR